MKIRLILTALLPMLALSVLAHSPSAHQRAQPVPESCVPFEGKDIKKIDLKDPQVKADYDTCEADRKLQKEAADKADPHDY